MPRLTNNNGQQPSGAKRQEILTQTQGFRQLCVTLFYPFTVSCYCETSAVSFAAKHGVVEHGFSGLFQYPDKPAGHSHSVLRKQLS